MSYQMEKNGLIIILMRWKKNTFYFFWTVGCTDEQ